MSPPKFSLQLLNQSVRATLLTLWPDIVPTVRFIPTFFDHEKNGDLFSDVCIELAGIIKCDPKKIFEQFVAAYPPQSGWSWSLLEGFLYLELPESFLYEADQKFESYDALSRVVISVPPRTRRDSPIGFLRVCAPALLQFELAHRHTEVELYFGEECVASSRNVQSIAALLELAFRFGEKSPQEAFPIAAQVRTVLEETPDSQMTIWSAPESFSTECWKELGRISRFSQGCKINYISKDRRFDLDAPPQNLRENLNDSIARSLVFSFAGLLHGSELDWRLYQLKERSNIYWLIDSLRERLDRYAGAVIEARPFACNPGVKPATLRSLRFLSAYRSLGAFYGHTDRYRGNIERALIAVTQLLNDPDRRRRIDRGVEGDDLQVLDRIRRVITGFPFGQSASKMTYT